MIEEKCEEYHMMNNCSIYVTYGPLNTMLLNIKDASFVLNIKHEVSSKMIHFESILNY